MKTGGNIIDFLDLTPQMAKQVQRALKRERRTPTSLMREALRTYFWIRGIPEETPTSTELRAIRHGRAEIKRGDFVTLEELNHELASPRRKARSKRA